MISQGEGRRLNVEDQRKVAELLSKRRETLNDARAEMNSFNRDDDIDLNDDATSQTHAMIFVDEAGASLVDVASTNGTFVNGSRLSEAALQDGDLLRLGETRFEISRD
ncbi:MAG: FHA domain-containing protein [Deltaproteobacteria bacterium]|nr:FHA domain-containing protein [Deltaproteobacteria bacterium]